MILESTENLQLKASEDAGGASAVYGLLFLKPAGALPALADGDIRVIRATAAATLTANAWTTFTPVLEKDLEPGRYQLAGFLPSSATIVAARALITGQVSRPGMIGIQGAEAVARHFLPHYLDKLMFYNMGEFSHTNIPQFQFLATAGDTSEVVILYLVRTGGVAAA
jgi:hypothetical protein